MITTDDRTVTDVPAALAAVASRDVARCSAGLVYLWQGRNYLKNSEGERVTVASIAPGLLKLARDIDEQLGVVAVEELRGPTFTLFDLARGMAAEAPREIAALVERVQAAADYIGTEVSKTGPRTGHLATARRYSDLTGRLQEELATTLRNMKPAEAVEAVVGMVRMAGSTVSVEGAATLIRALQDAALESWAENAAILADGVRPALEELRRRAQMVDDPGKVTTMVTPIEQGLARLDTTMAALRPENHVAALAQLRNPWAAVSEPRRVVPGMLGLLIAPAEHRPPQLRPEQVLSIIDGIAESTRRAPVEHPPPGTMPFDAERADYLWLVERLDEHRASLAARFPDLGAEMARRVEERSAVDARMAMRGRGRATIADAGGPTGHGAIIACVIAVADATREEQRTLLLEFKDSLRRALRGRGWSKPEKLDTLGLLAAAMGTIGRRPDWQVEREADLMVADLVGETFGASYINKNGIPSGSLWALDRVEQDALLLQPGGPGLHEPPSARSAVNIVRPGNNHH